MAFRTDKCIFYHIPKTGGLWVEKTVNKLGIGKEEEISLDSIEYFIKHPRGIFLKHIVPDDVSEKNKRGLFSFCFVRHPIEWYKSFWNYQVDRSYRKYRNGFKIGFINNVYDKKSRKLDLRFPLNNLFKCWSDNFEEFVNKSLEMFSNGFVTELYQYYVGKDLRGVDFIGKTENLREDLIQALMLAGEKFDKNIVRTYKKHNTSSNKRNELKISKELERKILKTEHWIIDNFYK